MNIKFEDKCVVKREVCDEWGNITKSDKLYDGACLFEQGGQTSLSITTRNDVVYLPSNDVIIESGDIIEVSTARGRQRNGVVNNARDIKMGISGILLTKIEIKQSKGN